MEMPRARFTPPPKPQFKYTQPLLKATGRGGRVGVRGCRGEDGKKRKGETGEEEREDDSLPNGAWQDSQLIGLHHETLKFPQRSWKKQNSS